MRVQGVIKDLRFDRSIKRTRRKVNWDVWPIFGRRYVIKDELTIVFDGGETMVMNALNGEQLYDELKEAKDKGLIVSLTTDLAVDKNKEVHE